MSRLSLPPDDWEQPLLDQIRGAIAGGVDVVQIRESGVESRRYANFVRACVHLAHGTRCRVIVNDRLDVAMAAAAHGVHLREDSVPMHRARSLGARELLVGRSVHDVATAAEARNADYMIAGSVFLTESKPGQVTPLGLDGLQRIVAAASGCPVWAVGGVTTGNITDVLRSGVHGVAAIGAFLPSTGAPTLASQVSELTLALRLLVDRRGS
jgi:thiamine-phosphate pyrophosphorylase